MEQEKLRASFNYCCLKRLNWHKDSKKVFRRFSNLSFRVLVKSKNQSVTTYDILCKILIGIIPSILEKLFDEVERLIIFKKFIEWYIGDF